MSELSLILGIDNSTLTRNINILIHRSLLQKKQSELKKEIQDVLVQIPNIPHPNVPPGKSDADNLIIKFCQKKDIN